MPAASACGERLVSQLIGHFQKIMRTDEIACQQRHSVAHEHHTFATFALNMLFTRRPCISVTLSIALGRMSASADAGELAHATLPDRNTAQPHEPNASSDAQERKSHGTVAGGSSATGAGVGCGTSRPAPLYGLPQSHQNHSLITCAHSQHLRRGRSVRAENAKLARFIDDSNIPPEDAAAEAATGRLVSALAKSEPKSDLDIDNRNASLRGWADLGKTENTKVYDEFFATLDDVALPDVPESKFRPKNSSSGGTGSTRDTQAAQVKRRVIPQAVGPETTETKSVAQAATLDEADAPKSQDDSHAFEVERVKSPATSKGPQKRPLATPRGVGDPAGRKDIRLRMFAKCNEALAKERAKNVRFARTSAEDACESQDRNA